MGEDDARIASIVLACERPIDVLDRAIRRSRSMSGPRYFTHYWKFDTWKHNQMLQEFGADGGTTDHTAGNGFRDRGVKRGDFVYLVTNDSGRLLVGARLEVDRLMTNAEARRRYGMSVWAARDHVIAVREVPIRFHLQVPNPIARRLSFEPDGKGLAFRGSHIDQQTLRGIRELTRSAARLLDRVLRSDAPTLQLVESEVEVAENVATFAREASRSRSAARSLCSVTTYWVRDPVTKAFGPSKFVGYRGMTLGRYMSARDHQEERPEFHGSRSMKAIEAALSARFRVRPQLASDLVTWTRDRLGISLESVDRTKWHFVDLPRISVAPVPAEDLDVVQLLEGKAKQTLRASRERNPEARRRCIDWNGTKCKVCKLELHAVYGEIGRGYIHVHHVRQIAAATEERIVDPRKDLVPVCPNCHAMLHQRTPPISVKELASVVAKLRRKRR